MKLRLPSLFRWQRPEDERLHIVDLGTAVGPVYAVGDVHGCKALLEAALREIACDHQGADGPATVILLGDMIDRGPDSAGVIDLLCDPRHGSGFLALMGNHERMMLSFAEDPAASWDWLSLGGFETLRSYGLVLAPSDRKDSRRIGQMIAAHVPTAHLAWLRSLPHGYRLDLGGTDHLFVHAGLDARRPLTGQSEAAVLWGLDGAGAYPGVTVVQGHVAAEDVRVTPDHILTDTAAHASGRLSVVRLAPRARPCVITVQESPRRCMPLGQI